MVSSARAAAVVHQAGIGTLAHPKYVQTLTYDDEGGLMTGYDFDWQDDGAAADPRAASDQHRHEHDQPREPATIRREKFRFDRARRRLAHRAERTGVFAKLALGAVIGRDAHAPLRGERREFEQRAVGTEEPAVRSGDEDAGGDDDADDGDPAIAIDHARDHRGGHAH